VGAADRGRRVVGTRGLLSGAAVSVLSRRHLRDCRAASVAGSTGSGAHWVGVLRLRRARGEPTGLAPRRDRRGSRARPLRAGDFLRRAAAEIGAGCFLCLTRAVVHRADPAGPPKGGRHARKELSAWGPASAGPSVAVAGPHPSPPRLPP